MAELLLELFSEEIPARMQERAGQDLARIVGEVLAAAGIAHDQPIRSFATPRRLTVVATGLPVQQADRVVERKGPRTDAPQQARDGFLRGLAGLDYAIEERDDKKAKVLFAVIREPGMAVAETLSKNMALAIARLPWPKSMRWGDGTGRWVRPLHSIVALFNGEVLRFALSGVVAGNTTRGHRFMAPAAFAVRDFADYVVRLRDARVILDGAERRAIIERAVAELAASEGYVVADDPALLDEITGLVEWPVPLVGTIDAAFMELPAEVLVGTMRANQKYLTLRTTDGGLAPHFVLVANNVASDGGAAIVAGNERVLRARLWDARFFWDQDRKATLESRLPALDKMVFHADLGSLGQRVKRLVALAGALVPHVPGAKHMLAERAAQLAKADLVTGMVGEFPELQGIMGGHYARAQGEPAAVAEAIRDHYAPKGPDDACPTAPDSIVVALADKLDMLVGFFGAGIRPTGSKDPFALRRAGLGVIRLILENGLRLNLFRIFHKAETEYRLADPPIHKAGQGTEDLMNFLADRLKVYLRAEGIRHDMISAVFAVGSQSDLVQLVARARALQTLVGSEDGRNLLAAYRRASSIVDIERKKDGRTYDGHPVVGALVDPAEEELHAALGLAQVEIRKALAAEDYTGAMASLAALRQPVDKFFEAVMVNVTEPDLRVNRLLLLGQIRASLSQVADFALIEGIG